MRNEYSTGPLYLGMAPAMGESWVRVFGTSDENFESETSAPETIYGLTEVIGRA